MKPRHPIYVVSKGRATARDRVRTTAYLARYGVDFRVIVESSEVDDYAAVVGRERVLVLDPAYQRDYDACDDLGMSKSKGPGPARNFAWDHAVASGAPWHWVMDDNIMGFYRLHKNLKVPVADGTIFRCMEDHAARYENVAMVGPQYFMFAPTRAPIAPLVLNTRIYSCNLIRNDAPYRWRGRYNEDTDLSLRMLKDGHVTIQYNAFLQDKLTTQHLAGGNTEAFYAAEGTMPKSEMLARLHPDVARVVFRFGRWHHYVDYDVFFKQLPRLRPGVTVTEGANDYGMVLEQRDAETGEWRGITR